MEFKSRYYLCVLWHVSTSEKCTVFGGGLLYIGPHMNCSDCVLNFVFCMCSLVVTMEIPYY